MPRIFSSVRVRDVRKLPDSMPWQIYQAYLSGPNALLRLFEETFGRVALYGPPDPDQQQRAIDDLAAHITLLKAQIEKLQEENREGSGRPSVSIKKSRIQYGSTAC